MRALLLSLALALSGCTAFGIGAVTASVVIGAGVLASSCYDHVSVSVRDARGVQVCDARVVAVRDDGSQTVLPPCYAAALTAGNWQIRAERGGRSASTTLLIPEERECGRYVQRVELTISETAAPMRSSASTSSTTPSSIAALGMP